MTHIYNWGNNSKRKSMKGRACQILAVGALRSALIEFTNGQREIVARWALKKI
jgi:hypothetical protein